MKHYLHILLFLLCLSILITAGCSHDDSPVKWRTAMDVPFTNQSFFLKKEFDKNVQLDSTFVGDPDTVRIGDTLFIDQRWNGSTSFSSSIGQIDTQSYTAVIKPFPLSNCPNVVKEMNNPIIPGTYTLALPIPLNGIYLVEFYDTLINTMPMTIKNSSTINLTNVLIGIHGVDTQVVASIPAGSSVVVPFDVRNKTLRNLMNINFTATSGGADINSSISMSLSLNGLIVRKCTVDGGYVKFTQAINEKCMITDTFFLKYIDVSEGRFSYRVNNYTGIPLKFNVEHRNVWNQWYCKRDSIISLERLGIRRKADSLLYYTGQITASGDTVLPKSRKIFNRANYTNSRILTEWNDSLKKTFSRIDYSFSTIAKKGDTIAITAGDSLMFSVFTNAFKIKSFVAELKENYTNEQDTQRIALSYPKSWEKATRDSLRGKVVYKNIETKVDFTVGVQAGTSIDTFKVAFEVRANTTAKSKISSLSTFKSVRNGSVHSLQLNIADIVNAFPDTLIYISKISIPKGTVVTLNSDNVFKHPTDISQMTAKIKMGVSVKPQLAWTINDPVTADLGSSTFSMIDAARYVGKLTNRKIDVFMDIFNNTNLALTAYVVCAPHKGTTSLLSMGSDRFIKTALSDSACQSYGFINLSGKSGITIPMRGKKAASSVNVAGSELDQVFLSDSCDVRCFIKLPKMSTDVMHDSDYVKIQSYFHIEGTNCSDSLIVW
jgi:hypothetical protein